MGMANVKSLHLSEWNFFFIQNANRFLFQQTSQNKSFSFHHQLELFTNAFNFIKHALHIYKTEHESILDQQQSWNTPNPSFQMLLLFRGNDTAVAIASRPEPHLSVFPAIKSKLPVLGALGCC